MKNIWPFFLACIVVMLFQLSACTKPKPEEIVTPPLYYVSGDYLCSDSTYNKIWTWDTLHPYQNEVYDSTYIIHINYVDTTLNIIQFRGKEYTLDMRSTYHLNYNSLGGYTKDSLNLSDNVIFYTHNANAGGTFLYTHITGTRIH